MNRRICIFCERWESGGIESFLSNVLAHMDLTGLRIDIVVSELTESVFTKPLEDRGITFVELSGSQRSVLQNRRRFRRRLQDNCYDAVYLNAFQALSLQYLKIAQQCRVNVRIAHSHNTDLRKSWLRRLKLAVHHIAKRLYAGYATQYWACSAAAASFMFPRQCPYLFVPNGIDTARFSFSPAQREIQRKELHVSDTCLVLGSVGRLCTQKNQRFTLELAASLLQQHKDVLVLLIGEGEDRPALEQHAQALGIHENVLFYGTTCKMKSLYAAMDLVAFPSLFEGLGIVAIEAQVNGLPVLCSEHVPPEAHITDLAIQLPLTLGPERWAEYAVQYSGHRTLTQTERQRCRRFDIDVVAGEIERLFRTPHCGAGRSYGKKETCDHNTDL